MWWLFVGLCLICRLLVVEFFVWVKKLILVILGVVILIELDIVWFKNLIFVVVSVGLNFILLFVLMLSFDGIILKLCNKKLVVCFVFSGIGLGYVLKLVVGNVLFLGVI